MSSPRVLQVNKLYPPWVGGVEKVVQQLAEGLQDRFETKVLACRPRGWGRRRTLNRVPVIETSSLGMGWGMPVSPTFPYHLAVQGRKADIVHFHLPFPLAVASALVSPLHGARSVVTYHSDLVRMERVMPVYGPLLDRFLSRVDLIMPTSPRLLESSPVLDGHRDKCRPVPLGIDLDEVRRVGEEKAEESSAPTQRERPLVLFVGRLAYYKGVRHLIDAMTYVDADLRIIGDGEDRPKYERYVRSEGLDARVAIEGHVTAKRLRESYEAADVFVLPSVERSEAFGLVQLEAMAHETPIVNTDLPTGVPYVSPHGETGYTVPPGDAEALARAINEILGDRRLARRFGRRARERAEEKFSEERLLDETAAIYAALLE